MNANELADELDKLWDKSFRNPVVSKSANMLRQQAKELDALKKQINQLSVLREPKIGDQVILLDDESEGIIVSLSISGYAAINFDDGAYGNYSRDELINLFAYKEKE
jgi:tyrosine-protein phosphatase YwqE